MTAISGSTPWLWTGAAEPHVEAQPIGTVLKEYRAARRMTQANLAEVLHVDQSYVSRIERGARMIRDVGFLLRITELLDIPPEQLGLSADLIQAVGVRDAADLKRRRDGDTASDAQASAIRASQSEWRAVRQHLNRHRSELARDALRLYGEDRRLGPTPLITLPSWMPDGPVSLDNIALTWVDGAQALPVSGAEPEALRACPFRAPGQQYDRYTSAIRYVDPPALFENRPSYRLLDASWGDDIGAMSFSLATYFDKLDVSETLGHEQAAAALTRERAGRKDAPGWADLPFRALVGDPFDCRRRAVIPAVTTLTIRRDHSGSASFLLHWRDPARVATAGGMYDVIPAGEFQPSSVLAWHQSNDFDLWRNIVRELSEELLGAPEHDGSHSAQIDYATWPLFRALTQARDEGGLYVGCFGIGLDALTLAATILTVIVIDTDVFDEIFGDIVDENSEGFTVAAGADRRSAEGIPFVEDNIQRLLATEPMASPGAACLYLALKHRRCLLNAS